MTLSRSRSAVRLDDALVLVASPFEGSRRAIFDVLAAAGATVVEAHNRRRWSRVRGGATALGRCRRPRSPRRRHARSSLATLPPTLIVSPIPQRERATGMLRAGRGGSLTKPIGRERLVRMVGALLGTVSAPALAPKVFTSGPDARLEGRRILLVDDNPVNRKLGLHLVTRAGCTCDLANDGAAALAALGQSSYDLVLMDCQMPIMDGYEATQEIRRRESGRARTIVVALTAGALPQDRAQCVAAGMDDYLTKPVSRDALLST